MILAMLAAFPDAASVRALADAAALAPSGTLRAVYLAEQSGAGGARSGDRRNPRRIRRSRARARQAAECSGRDRTIGKSADRHRCGRQGRGRYRLRRLCAVADRHGGVLADLHAGPAKLSRAGKLRAEIRQRHRQARACASPAAKAIPSRCSWRARSRPRRWSKSTARRPT